MKYLDQILNAYEYDDLLLKGCFQKETKYLVKLLNDKPKILDVGSGNGRTIKAIVKNLNEEQIKLGLFVGIDNEYQLINEAYKNMSPNILFLKRDALNIDFKDDFNLVYSSYNTIGDIKKSSRQKLVNQMYKVSMKNGVISNITWNNLETTTKWLEKYYSDIGFEIISLTNEQSKLKVKEEEIVFDRIPADEIINYYNKAGLKDIEVKQIGKLWVAVTGYKSNIL